MEHRHIIETIIAIYATLLKENKQPLSVENIDNGQKYCWKLDKNTKFIVEQFDEPADNHFHIESKDFTLILKEDNAHQKYFLDAPVILDEDNLGEWLGSMWLKCKGNLEN